MEYTCPSCGCTYEGGSLAGIGWSRSVPCEDCENSSGFMLIADAIEIVLGLALENALDSTMHKDDELYEEMKRQHVALNTVHDFAVNHLGDD